jgi:lipoprotein-releasing system ATP-binding protein
MNDSLQKIMPERIAPVDAELVIDAKGLSKSYNEGDNTLCIFHDLSFSLSKGESVSILGTSGSGKTTLLNILGGLDKATSGSVNLCGKDIASCSEKVITNLRNQHLGFVYQFHHLLPEFTAVENVAMPLYISGVSRKKADQKALEFLEKVGLTERANHKPSELSGGERQRVAIARALVNEPACVLMDEPTGNLDDTTAKKIQTLMLELKEQLETSFVVVTHDTQLAQKMDRVLMMEDGGLRILT